MESRIFFNDLTVIDFSIISPTGMIHGSSATLNLQVSGPVDGHEGVVIDFSAGKKQIKELIDGVGGFDHKCWVNVNDPNIIITQDVPNDRVTVSHASSGLTLTAEEDAFTWVQDYYGVNDITRFLNERLAPYSVSDVTLNTSVIPVPQAMLTPVIFHYVHGLKYSSSYGCKNIAHGHKSFITANVAPGYDLTLAQRVIDGIAITLDHTVFVDVEDLVPAPVTNGTLQYTVRYTTQERGEMVMSFAQKMVVLETQTTVEHLVEYIRARYYDQLKAAGVKELYVSEGLCKGAKVLI